MKSFEGAVISSSLFLRDFMQELGITNEKRAYLALRSALHVVRDRLVVDEAANLGAQLPLIIRGLYYEGWRPAGKPLRLRTLSAFLGRLQDECAAANLDPEEVARALFRVFDRHITRGEADDVRHMLPKVVAALWPEVPSARLT